MNDLAESLTYDLSAEVERNKAMTTAERAKMVSTALYKTVEQILSLAAIVEAMAQMGDDLDGHPSWWIAAMRKIASGSLLPQVFAEFHGELYLKAEMLPVQDQRRLLEHASVDLVVVKDGGIEILKVDPRKLASKQIKQVFARGHIRDAAEQRAWIENKMFPKAKKGKASDGDASVCKVSKGWLIVTGPCRLSKKDILMFLNQMES